MSLMEHMMGFMMERMSKEDKEAMMDSMMEKFFADITPEEKQKMMTDMMPKMMEGMNMMDMMPKMMMGMMSGSKEGSFGGMMGKMMRGGSGDGVSNMSGMMTRMMPHCIEMILPDMDAEKRGAFAAEVLATLIENGVAGLSDEQSKAFHKALDDVLNPPTQTGEPDHERSNGK